MPLRGIFCFIEPSGIQNGIQDGLVIELNGEYNVFKDPCYFIAFLKLHSHITKGIIDKYAYQSVIVV